MLENIKASYFIQSLFSHVGEKQKLKLVKFNKNLQNTINITLANYKYFTGRYIIYETNRFGKEYEFYNDDLIFEGEYLKGKRNGKGKEFGADGTLDFKGEYLNGKRHGKGKEYGLEGRVSFEGEYLNGKKNGKGKTYNDNGKLLFEGEYLNGKRNGKGKEYYEDGKLKFEGEYLNGERNGKGKEYDFKGELLFEGNYFKDTKSGKEYKDRLLIFEGEYNNKLERIGKAKNIIIKVS